MAPDATKHLSDVNTFHAAAHRIADLEAQVKRLEGTSNVHPDQLHRWQYNAYWNNSSAGRITRTQEAYLRRFSIAPFL